MESTNPLDSPDSASLTAVFSALLDPILASALKNATFLTRNAEDAEDLVQEACICAFRAFASFERGTNFKAWFLTIQHNCFLGRLRHASRRPQTVAIEDGDTVDSLSLFEQTRGIGLHKGGGDPAGQFLDKLDAGEIANALPDEFRVVATLYFVNELTYEQIAQVVECPLNTVRSRLHRARRLLQKSLWDVARERGIVPGDDYTDRELSPDEMHKVQQHLKICHDCARKFRFQEELIAGLKNKAQKVALPGEESVFKAKIVAVLEQEAHKSAPPNQH